MAYVQNHRGRISAGLTPAQARALGLLFNGGVLVAHGRHAYLIGREVFKGGTIQSLLRRGFVNRPRDMFSTDADAGRITATGRHALNWRERRVAA